MFLYVTAWLSPAFSTMHRQSIVPILMLWSLWLLLSTNLCAPQSWYSLTSLWPVVYKVPLCSRDLSVCTLQDDSQHWAISPFILVLDGKQIKLYAYIGIGKRGMMSRSLLYGSTFRSSAIWKPSIPTLTSGHRNLGLLHLSWMKLKLLACTHFMAVSHGHIAHNHCAKAAP